MDVEHPSVVYHHVGVAVQHEEGCDVLHPFLDAAVVQDLTLGFERSQDDIGVGHLPRENAPLEQGVQLNAAGALVVGVLDLRFGRVVQLWLLSVNNNPVGGLFPKIDLRLSDLQVWKRRVAYRRQVLYEQVR